LSNIALILAFKISPILLKMPIKPPGDLKKGANPKPKKPTLATDIRQSMPPIPASNRQILALIGKIASPPLTEARGEIGRFEVREETA
jgi:hypothetical protein